jgi:hypothetical protein
MQMSLCDAGQKEVELGGEGKHLVAQGARLPSLPLFGPRPPRPSTQNGKLGLG